MNYMYVDNGVSVTDELTLNPLLGCRQNMSVYICIFVLVCLCMSAFDVVWQAPASSYHLHKFINKSLGLSHTPPCPYTKPCIKLGFLRIS